MADLKDIVSSGDILIDGAVHRREGGLPIGNGVTGTLVWTDNDTLGMQINRVDVFANDSSTNSFNERHSDYGFGCGYVDINFHGTEHDVFQSDKLRQHLDIYTGTLTIAGQGVKCTCFAWTDHDVLVLQFSDSRKIKGYRSIGLRMLRPPVVRTKSHTATSQFHREGSTIALTQHFNEDQYHCGSCVAIGAIGTDVRVRTAGDGAMMLEIGPDSEEFSVCISTAAVFDRPDRALETAIDLLQSAQNNGVATVQQASRSWWHTFWERGYIHAESDDGDAQIISQHYMYFLYLMASCSRRGAFPPNFGAMLWNTEGDMRSWGVQQWWNNLSLYYRELCAANRLELLDPLFSMYFGMYKSAEIAARQQWDSKGIFIPETVWFNGLAELPEDIAQEMQDLYLFRKPWASRSRRFMEFAALKMPHSSRWNWKAVGHYDHGQWIVESKEDGPFGHVLHLLESNAKIAYLFWRRYEYTLDEQWLKERAYPMLKGVAEFFLNYPHFRKDNDGLYHIYHINNSEGVLGAKDTIEVMVALRGILSVAIKSAGLLGVDEEMCDTWREVLSNLAPIPDSSNPDALMQSNPDEDPFWVCGLKPAHKAHDYIPTSPILHFDMFNLERAEHDPELLSAARATYAKRFPQGITAETPIHVMWGFAIVAAKMGYADDWKQAALNQIACAWPEEDFCYFDQTGRDGVLENRMTLREGVNALGAERLGNAGFSLQLAVCQDSPPGPGNEPVIRLFPAWPSGWRGSFKLRCRGGFIVEAGIDDDVIGTVTIVSELGGTLRMRNPWHSGSAQILINGSPREAAEGSVIVLDTAAGDSISIRRNDP